jgi:hypothetical protein
MFHISYWCVNLPFFGIVQKVTESLTEPVEVSDLPNKMKLRQAQRPYYFSFWSAPKKDWKNLPTTDILQKNVSFHLGGILKSSFSGRFCLKTRILI